MEKISVNNAFPSYRTPPVVETVLGVQFDRLAEFKNAHLGAFWKLLDGHEWPFVVDAPLLPQRFERFSAASEWALGLQLMLSQDPASRIQIRNRTNDRMIQAQNGGLSFNWLGADGNKYPRYTSIREGFEFATNQFVLFLDQEKIQGFRPNQWEVTYVNEIPKGRFGIRLKTGDSSFH